MQKEKAVFDSAYYHSLGQITLGTDKFPKYLEQMKSEYSVQDNYYTVQSLDKDSPLYEDAKSLAMLRLAVQDAYDKRWNDEVSQFCLVSYYTESDYMAVRIEVVQ